MVVLGWLDDKHELSPRAKFAGAVVHRHHGRGCRRADYTLRPQILLFSYVITILWILDQG